MRIHTPKRSGSIGVLICFLMLPLLALVALSVDYGFLLYVRTDLQRVSDQVAIAAVRDLIPDENGNQDLEAVRATIRRYVAMNMGNDFSILDSDIEIGRYDPDNIYNSVDLLNDGIFDTVRITLRRDDLANNSVSLYFARIFDREESDLAATSAAVLQRARYLGPGTGVLPVTMDEDIWNSLEMGDIASIYGDGRIEDDFGEPIPGNWGTVDIGPTTNSTNDLRDQVLNGLSQYDLDSLQRQGAIPDSSSIDSQQVPVTLNGDTGFSAGIKNAISVIHGNKKLIPIYRSASGHGGNLTMDIVGWGAVEVVDSYWQGSQQSYLKVQKAYMYDGSLIPSNDLSDLSVTIEGVFTSPVLVQ